MDPFVFKLVAFVVVFGTGVLGGAASLRLAVSSGGQRLFSLGNAFAGGIFLGAGLIHMLPDAVEGVGAFTSGGDYPVAELVCAGGFLAALALGKVFVNEHALEGAGTAGGYYPYMLTLVLSAHSLIAGIALGAEGTVSGAAVILLAILAHKGSAAFALGVSLLRAGLEAGMVRRIVLLFSATTPTGILLGAGLTRLMTGSGEAAFEAVFDALAAGTFLYVAISHIIDEEFAPTAGDKANKAVLLAFGLGVMAMLALWL